MDSKRIDRALVSARLRSLATREVARAIMALADNETEDPALLTGAAGLTMTWTIRKRVLVVHVNDNGAALLVAIDHGRPVLEQVQPTEVALITGWFAWLENSATTPPKPRDPSAGAEDAGE